jgi:hypothetical protein
MSYFGLVKTRLRNSVQVRLNKLYKFIESVINNYPRSYLGFVTVFAIIGYAYILLFPLLIIISLLNIHQALLINDAIDWQTAAIWLLVTVVAGLVSYRAIRIKFKTQSGLTLTEEKAAELFKTVQQLSAHFKRPVIHKIIITADYELDIVKTPKWPLPVWSTNTLAIGLPVLQSLTPKQCECMLARRIGQFSKRENPLTNWLYQLRTIWQQHRELYSRQKEFGNEPLKWFFAVYAPFYAATSVYAARRDELNADSYAMRLFNDEQVREMVTADAVCRAYLQNQYWPAVYKIAALDKKSLPTPHAKMASALHASLKDARLEDLIEKAYEVKPKWRDASPSLQARIANIGHDKPRMKEYSGKNAAAHYLGTSMKSVITLIDKLWLQSFLQQRKQQRIKAQDEALQGQVSNV